MAVRTVRMDEESEKLLAQVCKSTGWTASEALKRGLRALDRSLAAAPARTAWDIYAALDLGSGGYASGPSTESRAAARAAIQRRAARR